MALGLDRLADLPHEQLTLLLVFGGASGTLVAALMALLLWRDRKRLGRRTRKDRGTRRPKSSRAGRSR